MGFRGEHILVFKYPSRDRVKNNTSSNKASMSNVANRALPPSLHWWSLEVSLTVPLVYRIWGPQSDPLKIPQKISTINPRPYPLKEKKVWKYSKNQKTVESHTIILTFKNYFIVIYVAKTISVIIRKERIRKYLFVRTFWND